LLIGSVKDPSLLRFGLGISASTKPSSSRGMPRPVRQTVLAESLGFDFVSASDHPCGTDASFEVWTMLTWIAAQTSRIQVATRVLGLPYRAPAMVAKMAESLDRLSGGRLILGLGGGSADEEFRAFGLGVPSPREKVDGLGEAIEIIRRLWTETASSYAGRLFHTDNASIAPLAGRPIPIWLGTFGPRALDLTGRLADGWIPSLGQATPDLVPSLLRRIGISAERAGREPEAITCIYNLTVRVDRDARSQPGLVAGSADEVTAQLEQLTRLGFDGFNLRPVGPDTEEQIDFLGTQIIPRLRGM
jgi:alkanesulfonate monooxygenase SsuD/methylene tetrahydromethanopterin reductase-like flavin-dependent oxidoreductase (luciferase family)